MLERYQIGKSLPSEKRPYLRMEIKIYENAIGRQRSRVSFKFMCKSLTKCLHEESTCWKDLLLKTSRFSFSLLIRSSKHLGIALFQLLMEHWFGARGDSAGCVISSGAGREAGPEYLWDSPGHIFPTGGAWIIQTPTQPPEVILWKGEIKKFRWAR